MTLSNLVLSAAVFLLSASPVLAMGDAGQPDFSAFTAVTPEGFESSPAQIPAETSPNLGTESRWASLAVGLLKDPAGSSVSSGIGISDSQSRSFILAMNSCRNSNSPAGVNCRIISTFNTGCGYVAIGTRSSTNDARYVTRHSAQDAYDACSQNGYSCQTRVLGTCL